MLIDTAEVTFKAGDGGNGKVSFRKNKKGPDGGNGGKGGDLYVVWSDNLNLLNQFSRETNFAAENGVPGESNQRSGRNGEDLVISLPIGTEVINKKSGQRLFEVTKLNEKILVAKGGSGGLGNWEFRSGELTTPKFAERGQKSHILPIILAFLGIGIIAGSGLYLYQKMYLKPAPSVTVATPQPSPVATQPINTLTTFSDFGVTFSYPSAWQRIRMSTLTESLLNGNVNFATPSASKTPEVVYLFFTPDEYSQLLSLSQSYRQDLAASKNQASASATTSALGNFVGLTTKAARLSELTITHLDGANALTSAQDLSKGQCSGTNISYSTSSPVDNSRIQSATVSGQLAYYLPPQSGCSYQNTTVIIDCGNMAKPASCEFAFNNAPDINHLSPDQEALLQSIKIQ